MKKLTHADDRGRAKMVDVSAKPPTRRTASASGRVRISPPARQAIEALEVQKGDPLATARIAGIMAAKQTPALIPLCHPLSLEHVEVSCTLDDDGVAITSQVVTTGKTGAEMEALTAVSVAALTIYDMCKALDRGMVIDGIALESKGGGKSGDYRALAGVCNRTLIINLPGSPRAVQESLGFLAPLLPHALEAVTGEVVECADKTKREA